MKTMKLMLAMTIVAMSAASCGSNQQGADTVEQKGPKMLVVYYSQLGNTKALAEEIAKKTGADIEAVEAVKPYDGDFDATIARCKQDFKDGTPCEINPVKANVADYDVIFVGAPVWFGVFAPPMLTWLEQVDLSGKKVVPFCTFGSGGLESSARNLEQLQPNAELLPGYGVRQARMDAMPKEVDQFLKAGGFIEGEYTPRPDFPEPHEATQEEKAIFDAAVGDYPMIKAKAFKATQRPIPEGTEYLFVAASKPRVEGNPSPDDIMMVYVTVAEGATPVFTKVVR